MNIGKFSVHNPVLINIVMCVILILGAGTLTRLPREDFPQITFYFVSVAVPYPGVAADDIERTVSIKLEQELYNLDDLKELRSFSSNGSGVVVMEFNETLSDDEFNDRFQEVRTRVGNVVLPEDAMNPIIDTFSTSDFLPVIQVILSGDLPYPEMVEHADRLQDRLVGIDGIAEINAIGRRGDEIVIDVNRERAETLGITLAQVARAVVNSNVTVPGGTLRGDDREYVLRTDETLEGAGELRDIVLTGTSGVRVDVGSIADVTEQYDRDDPIARFNGETAIILTIPKIPYADTVGIVNAVQDEVEIYKAGAPAGLEIDYFNDSSVEVRRNIQTLGRNIIFGFLLVVLVLYFFLGIRNSILTALGIPISFAGTIFVLSFIGETLNSNVLFAMVLVLGLIVDHAIVIIENCYRINISGASREESAINGVNQVVKPVLAATATTVAAFLPLAFLPGVIGKFLRVVPITVSIAMIVSTLEAFFILPSHYADWGKGGKVHDSRREHRFDRLREQFGKFLKSVYRHRLITVGVFTVMIIISVVLFGAVSQDLFVSDEFSYFYIDIELPSGSTQERTDEVVREYEKRILPLLERDAVVSITATAGFAAGDSGNTNAANAGQITIDLLDIAEGRTEGLDDIIEEMRMLTADIAGTEEVQFRTIEGGPPSDSPIAYRVQGDSFDDLGAVSLAIQNRLKNYARLVDIRDNLSAGSPELQIEIDNDEAARLGVSPRDVGNFIRDSFSGISAGVIFRDNEETDIEVRYEPLSINRPEQLLQLRMTTPNNQRVPLSSFVNINTGYAFGGINRIDQKREVLIEAGSTDTEDLFVIDNDIENFFNTELAGAYPDVELVRGGQFTEFANLLSDILLVMGIGVFLIYTILGTQFRSYTQPFIILLAVPFAFLGVVLYLLISGTSLSTIILYAAVALAGIAVNDSIVLISFINELRAEGKKTGEAIIEAAKLRLRPIILTSLTTIVGLVPTSLGLGGKSIVWVPMANTIIFGLLFSTLTTLVAVPCIYGLLFDRRHRLFRRKHDGENALQA